MKVVIAPDSYKESLSAMQVATEIEAGFREIFPDATYVKVPVADGGEGTVEAIVAATDGRLVRLMATGPLGERIESYYGLTGDGQTAVVEMAAASGLMLVPPSRRNPLVTTTFGVGDLILDALNKGARSFIIGIGGSATNDGGCGMLQALGVRLLDVKGKDLGFGGGELERLDRIDVSGLDPRIKECRIQVACDVNNPLVGPKGASAIFGPQKGATPDIVRQLDANLTRYGQLVEETMRVAVLDRPGAGAAGGLGAALFAFLNATLRSGADIICDYLSLDSHVANADLVITGEGRMDSQTMFGKTPMGVARVAARHKVPVVGIAGCLSHDVGVLHDNGIEAVFSVLRRSCSVEDALAEGAINLRQEARNIAAVLKLGMALQ